MTHAALKDLAKKWHAHSERERDYVRETMRECADELSAALSAMEGEAFGWVVHGKYHGKPELGPQVFFYYGEAGKISVEAHRQQGDKITPLYTAPPPQQAATCHNCGVQCYGWHRCPPAHQPGEETKALVQRALDGLKVPKLSPSKTEYFTAGVRSLAQAINEQLRALAPKEAGHDR